MMMAAMISAKGRLSVESLFKGRFLSDKNARVTMVSGTEQLRQNYLSDYRSITLQKPSAEQVEDMEKAINADAKNLSDREMSYKDGQLYYAFLFFDGDDEYDNRYVIYLNQLPRKGNKVVLIYLEGPALPQTVKKMLKND